MGGPRTRPRARLSAWAFALLGAALVSVALHQLRAQTAPPTPPPLSPEIAGDPQSPQVAPPAPRALPPDQEVQEAREQEKLRAADLERARKELAVAEKYYQEAQARLVKALEAKAQILTRDAEAVVKELESFRPRPPVPSYTPPPITAVERASWTAPALPGAPPPRP
jgi:hypothetical protein